MSSDIPTCSISKADYKGSVAILCTAHANPQNVTFSWKIQDSNETISDPPNVYQEGIKSYLVLDSSVEAHRTYQCYATNIVGSSDPCEIDVAGKRSNNIKQYLPIDC